MYDQYGNELPQKVQENSNLVTTSSDYSSVLIFALDPKPIIDELIHNLKNEVYDPEKNAWIKFDDPLLNDAGISKFISLIQPLIGTVITLSNFSEDQINKKMKVFGHGIKTLLQKHYKQFGISNLILATSISIMVRNVVHSSLNKAKNGAMAKLIGQTEKRIEQFGNTKGGLNKLLPNI